MSGENGITALLVEDNCLFRQEMRNLLAAQFPSMQILEAEEGEEALQKFAEHSPDVVFMDISLPGEKNGLSLTRVIKRSRPEAVVAILTNYDQPEYRQAAEACGADRFLVKGDASAAEINAVIEWATGRKKWVRRRSR